MNKIHFCPALENANEQSSYFLLDLFFSEPFCECLHHFSFFESPLISYLSLSISMLVANRRQAIGGARVQGHPRLLDLRPVQRPDPRHAAGPEGRRFGGLPGSAPPRRQRALGGETRGFGLARRPVQEPGLQDCRRHAIQGK